MFPVYEYCVLYPPSCAPCYCNDSTAFLYAPSFAKRNTVTAYNSPVYPTVLTVEGVLCRQNVSGMIPCFTSFSFLVVQAGNATWDVLGLTHFLLYAENHSPIEWFSIDKKRSTDPAAFVLGRSAKATQSKRAALNCENCFFKSGCTFLYFIHSFILIEIEKAALHKQGGFEYFLSVFTYSGLRLLHNPYWKLGIVRLTGTLPCFNALTDTRRCLSLLLLYATARNMSRRILNF